MPFSRPARTIFIHVRNATSASVAVLFTAWVVGQFARDAVWITGLCFYIPSVVVAAALVIVAAQQAVAGRVRWSLLATGAALPPLVFVCLIENQPVHCGESSSQLRVVHWNTAGRPARPGVGEYLLAERADLYVLTDSVNAAHVGVLRDRLGAEYQAVAFANMAVIGRGDVRTHGWLVDRDGFEIQSVTWTSAGRPITLLALDLPSDVRVARNPLLREVNALIERYRPDLVMGRANALNPL